MSTKLDQSLDQIMTDSGATRGPRPGRRPRAPRQRKATAAAVAPAGGVTKSTRTKNAPKAAPTAPSAQKDSKIVVSNLPKDVDESQIKVYFAKSIGPVKRVDISYGPNGQSRGIANIVFHKGDGASKAVSTLNGILVDNKPMKIEVVVDASQAPAVAKPKTLDERIAQPAQPKAQPKSAAATNENGAAKRGKGGRKGRAGGAPRSARPAKKTAEELDSEMADYFESAPAAEAPAPAAPAAPAAATNGDAAPMDEEIL